MARHGTESLISPTDLLALPSFENDYRDLPLFIESCEEFINTYADKDNETNPINFYLVKLIKSRLVGDAKHLVSIRECKTWPEIKELLESNFGDQRTEEHLFHDLSNFRSNSYNGMGVEIKTLLGLLLAKCKSNVSNKNEFEMKEKLYNKVALNSYLKNLYFLNRNIGDPVRFQNPQTLDQAIRFVVDEVNWQRSCTNLQFINISQKFPKTNTATSQSLLFGGPGASSQSTQYNFGIPFGTSSGQSQPPKFPQQQFFPQPKSDTAKTQVAYGSSLFGSTQAFGGQQEPKPMGSGFSGAGPQHKSGLFAASAESKDQTESGNVGSLFHYSNASEKERVSTFFPSSNTSNNTENDLL